MTWHIKKAHEQTNSDQTWQSKLMGIGEGIYIGETSRSMSEICVEHYTLSNNVDEKSYIMKHWVNKHADMPS